jgi:hypothetical protein
MKPVESDAALAAMLARRASSLPGRSSSRYSSRCSSRAGDPDSLGNHDQGQAPTATPSCSREAFERHQSPVWVQRFRGHEPHAAQPGTFAHTYAVIVLITRGLSRIRHTGDLVLRAGDVHLIPPGDAHSAAHFDDMEGWGLAFHPEAFPQDDTSWGSQTG